MFFVFLRFSNIQYMCSLDSTLIETQNFVLGNKRVELLVKGIYKHFIMSQQIFNTNETFPFSAITLSKPTTLTGGNHLIRFSIDSNPIYFSPPKCYLLNTAKPVSEEKKPAKRTTCDFIFTQENDQFLQWVNNLEEFAQNKLLENSQWFETPLTQEDIDNSFTSPLKVKSKQYLLRVNIPQSKNDKNGFKIYNEDEQEIQFEQIDESRQIMCVLELRGIKFSSKYFQIDMDVKQMMALNPVDMFDKCILKRVTTKTVEPVQTIVEKPLEKTISIEPSLENIKIEKEEKEIEMEEEPVVPIEKQEETKEELVEQIVEKENKRINKETGLEEIDLDLDGVSDTIELKDKNEVYYEMYIEARRKAKIARDLALAAYLEARRIKNTYMLNDIINSDDEDESDMEELEELEEET